MIIKWLGHAGFMIKGDDRVIYIDPYLPSGDIPFEDMADILLITQEYDGHCHPDSIRKVRKPDATTLVPESVSLEFRGDARRVTAGDSLVGELSIKGVGIEVVPVYVGEEIPESAEGGVGYIIEVGGIRIYHTGDTGITPGMNGLSVDVALIPIGGASPMDDEKAAEAAVLISPKMVIPMHYNPDSGDANPEKFAELVRSKTPDIDVTILDPL
ncbi:MBL fold metallo-hydrolase [Methanolobus sp.]|uniref:MBL fold metallo-hydrolase n=1 Tax=Methanolobus sp. TaxID=1874737 RepID=UPI00318321B6